jgi:hypothetical protein
VQKVPSGEMGSAETRANLRIAFREPLQFPRSTAPSAPSTDERWLRCEHKSDALMVRDDRVSRTSRMPHFDPDCTMTFRRLETTLAEGFGCDWTRSI